MTTPPPSGGSTPTAPAPPTLRRLLEETRAALADAPNPPHPREEERLLLAASGLRTVDLLADPDRRAGAGVAERLARYVSRRLAGEPIQYLLGEWEFRGHPIRCDRRALIPRPETEMIVDILAELAPEATSLLDLGTGSGAIALAARLELPKLGRIVAIDRSPGAAALARENARCLGARIAVVAGCWADPLAPRVRFDAVVSNPPYIDPAREPELPPEVRDFEPKEALFAGGGGLDAIGEVLDAAERRLVPGGLLVVEIGSDQEEEVRRLCEGRSLLRPLGIRRDLAGRIRFLVARRGAGAP